MTTSRFLRSAFGAALMSMRAASSTAAIVIVALP